MAEIRISRGYSEEIGCQVNDNRPDESIGVRIVWSGSATTLDITKITDEDADKIIEAMVEIKRLRREGIPHKDKLKSWNGLVDKTIEALYGHGTVQPVTSNAYCKEYLFRCTVKNNDCQFYRAGNGCVATARCCMWKKPV
jgi:hypothetical protein